MDRTPETIPTQRLDPVRSYMTHDWAAVRATAPMSKRASDVRRRAKPGMAKTWRTRGGRGRDRARSDSDRVDTEEVQVDCGESVVGSV